MNNSAPPILVGERVFWLASGSGIPQASTVRWIGHLPEIGPEWTIGVELDNPLPYGGIDGAWGNRLLFTCKPKHGLLVPQSQIAPATHCGSGNIANFIPDIGANSKLKTSCKDLRQSSLNSLDNNKNNQIIKYKPNITTSSTAEVRNYDFGNSHDLPAISSAAFLPEGSQRDEISPRAPPRNRVELKLKYADITGDGNEALFSDYRNEIAWFKVKHNNDGSRIVDVCNLNRRTRTKDVDPNADNVKRMSGVFSQNVQASSQVESISVSDSVQFASRRQVFFRHGRSHSDSSQDVLSSSSRKEKTASGLFSFLRWFRRIKSEGDTDDEDDEDDDDETGNSNNCSNAIEVFPPSPRLIRSNSSSCGSVDTLFSTATASSFAFIHPYNYRPFGPVLQSQTRIADDADTETYRQRVKQSERVRQLDKNISLKKKYNLFGSGTICRSLDSVAGRFAKIENTDSDNNLATGSQGSTLNRKKRKAPPPPQLSPNDYSLPSTLNHLAKQKTTSGKDKLKVNNLEEPFHRRTVSESARDKKAGAYCHVRGKRKAPPPPVTTSAAGNEKVNKSGNHSLGRKKRPAPQPPKQVNSEKQSLTEVSSIEKQSFTVDPSTAEASSTSVENKNNVVRYRNNNSSGREKKQGSLSLEEKERLLKNIAKLQAVAEKRSSLCCTPPSSPNLSQKMAYSLSNDTLRLEKGILKPNRSEDGASPSSTASSSTSNLHVDATKLTPSSPVSPRPWYKRNIIKDNHSSPSGKTLFDKKKEKTKVDDWMPDVAISRSSLIVNDSGNKFNLFSPKSDKVDEKRKSQISMLVNISELDREAAEIVQKEHAKEKAILDAEDAKFYSFPELQDSATNNDQHIQQSVDSPKRSSARELVSLFNAITNVTKVTVNTTFFSRETASLFSRDGREKRFSFGSNATREDEKLSQFDRPSSPRNTEIKQETVIFEARETYLESPGEKRRRWNRVNAVESDDADVGGEAGRVTIEEIKEFDDEEDENAEKNSKTQALFEANRLKRHHSPSPSIPTIAEVSETTSSVATTPGSAIQSLASPTTPTTPHPFPGPSTVDPKPLTKTPVSNSYWACTQCTLENPSWRFTCEVCDTWKPSNIKTKQVILPFNRLNKPTVTNKDENEKEQLNLNDDSLLKNIDDEILLRKKLHDTKEIDIEKDAITVNDTSPEVTNEKPIDLGESTDIEEVRKARLAFFNKSDTIEDQADRTHEDKSLDVLNIIKVSGVKPVIQSSSSRADERLKLREMLKDLKHSLPKRSKQAIPSGDSTEKSQPSSTSKKNVDSSENAISYGQVVNDTAVKNLGAIKKTTTPIQKNDKRKTPAADVVKSVEVDEKKNEKAEVYLMKTETIIEEIRMKKQPDQKPNKVSSSAQTSSIIRKCDIPPNTEKPIVENHLQKTNSNSYVVPITEEEYTIKDGVLSSSISKNKTTIGKKTFELILAQDFADIKATKTGKGFLPAHVYANLPSKASLASKVNDADEPSSSSDALSTPAAVSDDQATEVDRLTEKLTCAKGIADFRADLVPESDESKSRERSGSAGGSRRPSYLVNTVAVNRRLRRLEAAIAKGDLHLAAQLARELAQLKINCSVTRHKVIDSIVVDMYVEDKVSHQGPIAVTVSPSMSVAELKMKVERELEIPAAYQRWILGKQLAGDDKVSLADLGVSVQHCPIFLYLVAPESSQATNAVEFDGAAAAVVEAAPEMIPPQPPPPPEQIKRGGWYYNDEEDKYSFCADSDQSGSTPGSPEPVELISDYSEEEELSDRPPTPPQRHIDLETPSTSNGTLKLGWKCDVCTLMNSPLRPGCAACTSPRPAAYQIPTDYQASEQELMRIQNEEKVLQVTAEERLKNYQELVNLENADIVASAEPFDCPICLLLCQPGDGVVLRDCLHTFCRPCLVDTVQYSEEAEVKCPYRDANYACDSALLQREIKALVPADVYEQHLAKSMTQAENKIGNTFHCKTPDCRGWCIFEDNVNEFPCPVCNFVNCLTCQAIHTGINCKQYQERAKQDSDTNADARRTNAMLEEMVERGEAMKCPTCQVILMKKWGCDWLRCSMCKTEICWVTRGPRWGPLGKGDTSGGCHCGVNGVKCHPKCNYCH